MCEFKDACAKKGLAVSMPDCFEQAYAKDKAKEAAVKQKQTVKDYKPDFSNH